MPTRASSKRLVEKPIMLTLYLLLLAMLVQHAIPMGAEILQTAKLTVYISPPTLPADGRSYPCIYVQIQDLNGTPIPASSEVRVTLTSSNLDVGCVEAEAVIAEGETFTTAVFNTTLKPGLTIITASASGFISGYAVLVTVNPSGASPPFKLNVYAQSIMPAEAGLTGTLTVQALGSNDIPLTLNRDVKIILTSSNTTVLDVPPYAVIAAGKSHVQVQFKLKGIPGRSVVTALADGFLPGSTELTVREAGGKPVKLMLTLTPPFLPPDDEIHEGVVQIQLLDATGAPAKAMEDVQIYISTSNVELAYTFETITIRRGGYSTSASIKIGVETGDAVITAAASNLETASSILHVAGLTPSKLAIYVAPPVVTADGRPKNILTVQVQDANGVPLASNRDLYIHLTSSSPGVGQVPSIITISKGESTCKIPFIPTLNPGFTNITASTQGLEAASTTVETWAPTLNVVLEAPSNVRINQTFTVRLIVSSGGFPVQKASVEWRISGAEVLKAENATDADGKATITLKQTSEKSIIAVKASKPGYLTAETSRSVLAIVPISTAPTISILGYEIPINTLAFTMAVVVTILLVAYIFVKLKIQKRKPEGVKPRFRWSPFQSP